MMVALNECSHEPAPDEQVLERYMDELLNHTDHCPSYRALIEERVKERLARIRAASH